MAQHVRVAGRGHHAPAIAYPPPPPRLEFDVSGTEYTQDELLKDLLARRIGLSPQRRASITDWVASLDATASTIVQVGANDHSKHYGNVDPARDCVLNGWRALLMEPVVGHFNVLRKSYEEIVRRGRTRLLNAAVCDRSECGSENRTFWWVDTTNATGNWGTNHSDARCAKFGARWITEIAALNEWHVVKEGRNLKWTESRCKQCSAALGHELPPNCLRDVIKDNLVTSTVQCACLRDEVSSFDSVTLLMIDTEGYDFEVLKQYPFDRLMPARVVFESMHLSNIDCNAAASFMMRLGYANILGGLGKVGMTIWHHPNSTERYNATAVAELAAKAAAHKAARTRRIIAVAKNHTRPDPFRMPGRRL